MMLIMVSPSKTRPAYMLSPARGLEPCVPVGKPDDVVARQGRTLKVSTSELQPVVDRQPGLLVYLLMMPDCSSVKIMEGVVDLDCLIINDPTDDIADFRHEPVGDFKGAAQHCESRIDHLGRIVGGSNRGNEILEGRNPQCQDRPTPFASSGVL